MGKSPEPKQLAPKSRYNRLTHARIKKFLKDLEKTGSVRASAACIGVTPAAIYKACDRYEGLREQIDIARGNASRAIEMEMRRRGIEGVEEDVYYEGVVVGQKKKYSDQILAMLAKASDPERYGSPADNLGSHATKVNVIGNDAINKLAGLLNLDLNEKVIVEDREKLTYD